MSAKKKVYDVISPDGFSIHPEDTYPSKKAAIAAFRKWRDGYKAQGYYSSVDYGRIDLRDLESYCTLKQIEVIEDDPLPENACPKCGSHFITHNDDGSCVVDEPF